ncbi:MAG: hypothetical protein ACRCUT_05050, partial [Spirochaetota bacterium]
MKRGSILITVCIPLCFFTSNIYSQTPDMKAANGNVSITAHGNSGAAQSPDAVWKKDSKTILSIVSDLRAFSQDESDSSIHADEKKKQFLLLHEQMNRKHKGTWLVIGSAQVKDVKPEKELTPYGREKSSELMSTMKNSSAVAMILSDSDPAENSFVSQTVSAALFSD